jgi:hypothetical protein
LLWRVTAFEDEEDAMTLRSLIGAVVLVVRWAIYVRRLRRRSWLPRRDHAAFICYADPALAGSSQRMSRCE